MTREKKYMRLVRQRAAMKAMVANPFAGVIIMRKRMHLDYTDADIRAVRGNTRRLADDLIFRVTHMSQLQCLL